MSKQVLKLGLPKGSLQQSTFELFKKAGYSLNVRERSYYPSINDPEISVVLLRAQEMSRYVEDGALDAGITGYDWIQENNSDVHTISTLEYSKVTSRPVRWVLAVPEDSPIQSVRDLQGKRIATELVNASRRYLEAHGVTARVEFSWGATEVKVPELVDAIIDVTETGSSLRANKLKIVDTLFESRTQFICNHNAGRMTPSGQTGTSGDTLEGSINAESKVGLKMNVKEEDLERILNVLPGESPTQRFLHCIRRAGALEIIVDESIVREIIPALKRGAVGIIEYPLNKVFY